jgi:copper homeostasis protein
MQNSLALEVCVESIDHAVAAERGGAHRIELCSDLASGGITPSAGLIEVARDRLRLPIHVLIRPREGDFCYSDYEFAIMERDIRMAKHLRADGIVLGVLDANRRVDIARTRKLVGLARPLPVTFHRAFDLCQDLDACLEAVIQTGAARILTSGGQTRATDNIAALARLVHIAGDRIVIMPGGGVDMDNAQFILRRTAAREIHTSLGLSAAATNNASASPGEASDGADSSEFEGRVRKVRKMLEVISHDLVHEADLTS